MFERLAVVAFGSPTSITSDVVFLIIMLADRLGGFVAPHLKLSCAKQILLNFTFCHKARCNDTHRSPYQVVSVAKNAVMKNS